jgi:hypothetical protein
MFLQKLVTTYKAKQHHNPENHNPHFHHHENLKSHPIILTFLSHFRLKTLHGELQRR